MLRGFLFTRRIKNDKIIKSSIAEKRLQKYYCTSQREANMERIKKLKSTNLGLILIIIGALLIFIDCYVYPTSKSIWVAIGGSLLSSGILLILTVLYLGEKRNAIVDYWGLDKIYETRVEKGKDSDPKLKKAKTQLDVIAFGLKSFRNKHRKDIETILNNGVNIRILTMNPKNDNPFLIQREIEEAEQLGQIKNSIEQLVSWADSLNKRNYKGKIEIRGYKCMTQEFYWRVDDEMYIGPYWYGLGSQQTVTYKYCSNGKMFELYSEHFEMLWNSNDNNIQLTKYKSKEV